MKYYNEYTRANKATVYKILYLWNEGGIGAVKVYLNDDDTVILKDSWPERIKDRINKKQLRSVSAQIENLYIKFKISDEKFLSNKAEGFENDSSTGGWAQIK